MKTDKELLQLAAKAAGYDYLTEWSEKITDYDSEHYNRSALHASGEGGQCQSFNPLDNDGDAFRLAVDLGVDVICNEYHSCVQVFYIDGSSESMVEPYGEDKHAATRRSIVRAAAAIGEDAE